MIREVQGYCISGNLATMICTSPACKYSSLTCLKENCKCSYPHEDCSLSQVKPIMTKLLQKVQQFHQPLQKVFEWY